MAARFFVIALTVSPWRLLPVTGGGAMAGLAFSACSRESLPLPASPFGMSALLAPTPLRVYAHGKQQCPLTKERIPNGLTMDLRSVVSEPVQFI